LFLFVFTVIETMNMLNHWYHYAMAGKPDTPIDAVATLEGQRVPYRVRVSARARRLRISIANGSVSVTLPRGVPHRAAEDMLREHSTWVLKQLARSAKSAQPARALPPDVILLRGDAKRVIIIEEAERKTRVLVAESTDRLTLRVPAGTGKVGRSLALPWLKALAREEISAAADLWAPRVGVRFTAITIRDQKTRWGSCSSRGTLSFNWRLVMAPPSILEYVVIHELAHRKQPNHSPAFWQIVALHFPDYKKARKWLRANTALLRPPDLV
jgi:predicted metal-dependent hydrolase